MHALNDVATIRRIAFWVGTPALLVACLMTFQFGRSMSMLHAVSLALLTVAGSVIFPYAKHIRQQSKPMATAFLAMGMMFLSVEYFSHLGYTVGTRVLETEDTGVQNTTYKNAQEALSQNKSDKTLWLKQLEDLKTANGWTATVTAEALRSQLAIAQKDIDLEAARKGCKQKCRERMKEKADLEGRIAIAEKTADLSTRIEATQRLIDKATTTAAETKHKSSSVVAQTNFVAQLATGSLDPDALSSNWTQIVIGAFIALVTTFLAPVMLSIAFGPATGTEHPQYRSGTVVAPHRNQQVKPNDPPGQSTHIIERERYIDDRGAVEQMKRMIAEALRHPHAA
jgi:hypothetical protein